MESNIKKFEKELKKLINDGQLLLYSMGLDLGVVDESTKKELEKMKLPNPSGSVHFNFIFLT